MKNPIEVAKKYLGMKEESGNRFTNETSLGKMLHAAGQKDGEAWCCYFAEGVFCEAFPEHEKQLRSLFSANCVQTLQNFKDAGFEVTDLPVVGSLMIMQKFKNFEPQTTGHAGIPCALKSSWEFETIEGNSNDEGGREGIEVAHQTNRKALTKVENGLKTVGFVNIAKKYGYEFD